MPRIFLVLVGMGFFCLSSLFIAQIMQADSLSYGLSMLGYTFGSIGLGLYLVYHTIFKEK